jgi:ABC-type lipoprotein export system ATPase subunit
MIALRGIGDIPHCHICRCGMAALDWKRGQHFLGALHGETITNKTVKLIFTHDARVLDYVDHIYEFENEKLCRCG